MTTVPFTAWEQAVFVVLFCVFVFALLSLVLKIVTAVKPIVSETNKSFQEFILQRDTQWQRYMTELRQSDREADDMQNRAFADRNEQVVKALNALAGQIQVMQSFNLEHHQAMTAAINDMHEATRPRSAARK